MLNGIALIAILIVIIYSIIHVLSKEEWQLIVAHHLFYIITSFLILLFNFTKKYKASAFAVHIGFPVSFFISCILLGKDYHVEYLLSLTAIGSIFMFRKTRPKYFLLGFNLFLLTIINLYYSYFLLPFITPNFNMSLVFNYFTELVVLLMIYNIVRMVFQYNRRLNRKLKDLSTSQEKIIQERTAEIEEKSKALEQSNHELKQFAYISAHDMREPLRNIIGFSQLLGENISKSQYENTEEYIKMIKKSVSRLDTITKDIVNYTELEEHLNQVEEINVIELVTNISTDLKNKSKKTIIFDINRLPVLNMNPKLCYYLFYNLIENAIQYCDKEIVKINVKVLVLESHYQFSIEDNGIGIASEYFDKIYRMFKRLHNDISKSGLGIGLSICKKIVTNYGGKIWVESKVGEGSTFHFTVLK